MPGHGFSDESDERLSRIATRWSMVLGAHKQNEDAETLRQILVQRYSAAAYRYLLGAVRDPQTAEELCNEFAVRVLQGAFHRAEPDRGRFRDYLKKTLSNLVNEHHRTQQRWPRPFPSETFEPGDADADAEAEPSFEDCFREELLDGAWKALAESQPQYHAVLKLRLDKPDLSSRELAEELSRTLGKQLSRDTVRKTLERSRTRLAELLLDEVARVSESDDPEALHSELKQLNLLQYCRSALDRRRSRN